MQNCYANATQLLDYESLGYHHTCKNCKFSNTNSQFNIPMNALFTVNAILLKEESVIHVGLQKVLRKSNK